MSSGTGIRRLFEMHPSDGFMPDRIAGQAEIWLTISMRTFIGKTGG
jgi:hypothetical protein